MCVKEVVRNLVEQDSRAGERVDVELLKEILDSCPIQCDLPRMMESAELA